jgi:hypothetical protein
MSHTAASSFIEFFSHGEAAFNFKKLLEAMLEYTLCI